MLPRRAECRDRRQFGRLNRWLRLFVRCRAPLRRADRSQAAKFGELFGRALAGRRAPLRGCAGSPCSARSADAVASYGSTTGFPAASTPVSNSIRRSAVSNSAETLPQQPDPLFVPRERFSQADPAFFQLRKRSPPSEPKQFRNRAAGSPARLIGLQIADVYSCFGPSGRRSTPRSKLSTRLTA